MEDIALYDEAVATGPRDTNLKAVVARRARGLLWWSREDVGAAPSTQVQQRPQQYVTDPAPEQESDEPVWWAYYFQRRQQPSYNDVSQQTGQQQ